MVKKMLFCLIMLAYIITTCGVFALDDYPKKIVDSAGREVEIKMPVERIIVQNGGAARALAALGAADKVIGVADFISKNPELYPLLKDRQVVGTWKSFDYELIGGIATKDDSNTIVPNIIVLCYYYNGMSFSIDSFEKGFAPFKNITLIALDFTNPDNITDSMHKLGSILDKEDTANEFIRWREEKMSQIESTVKGLPKPNVYIESSASKALGELTTFGPDSGFGIMVRRSGGYDIATPLKEGFPKVTWEWVVSQNPDVMLIWKSSDAVGWESEPSKDTVVLEEKINEVLDRPGSSSITAIKDGRVYLCHSMMLSGIDDVVGLAWLAKILHPEADVDPTEIWTEYQRITGFEYPDDRIFVYPEANGGQPQ
ncbi:MAG: Cobalamin-binding protein precursor [Methanosaeta sp. PtaU1.Bin060]|nr:MAG: Cobalamin-binding protein precursor [Methanosaeta sp. PtaU1.Bin060]